MTQKTYTFAGFCELLEKRFENDGGLYGVNVRYPSDCRCRFVQYVFVERKSSYMMMLPTDDIDSMRDLFRDDSILSCEWHLRPNEYVTIIRRS